MLELKCLTVAYLELPQLELVKIEPKQIIVELSGDLYEALIYAAPGEQVRKIGDFHYLFTPDANGDMAKHDVTIEQSLIWNLIALHLVQKEAMLDLDEVSLN